MFKGEFKIGGKTPHVKGKSIKLYRHNIESDEYTTEFFKKSIDNAELGWDGINQQLLYRDEDGKLWKAKFEETDG
jgi:hypothetical protein